MQRAEQDQDGDHRGQVGHAVRAVQSLAEVPGQQEDHAGIGSGTSCDPRRSENRTGPSALSTGAAATCCNGRTGARFGRIELRPCQSSDDRSLRSTARADGRARRPAQRVPASRLGPADDDAARVAHRPGRRPWPRSNASATRCSSPIDTGRLLEAAAEPARRRRPRLRRGLRWCGWSGGAGRRRGGCRADWRPTWPAPPRSATRRGSWRASESDFASFMPYLERNFELVRRYVDCFDDLDCAYDAAARRLRAGGAHGRGRRAVRRAQVRAAGPDRRPCPSTPTGSMTRSCTVSSRSHASASWSPGCSS